MPPIRDPTTKVSPVFLCCQARKHRVFSFILDTRCGRKPLVSSTKPTVEIETCCQRCGNLLPSCHCGEERVLPKAAAEDIPFIKRRLAELEKERIEAWARKAIEFPAESGIRFPEHGAIDLATTPDITVGIVWYGGEIVGRMVGPFCWTVKKLDMRNGTE